MFVSIPIRRAHQSASSSADNDIIALTKKLLQDQKGSFTFRANRTFSIYLFLSFQDNLSVGARRGGLSYESEAHIRHDHSRRCNAIYVNESNPIWLVLSVRITACRLVHFKCRRRSCCRLSKVLVLHLELILCSVLSLSFQDYGV